MGHITQQVACRWLSTVTTRNQECVELDAFSLVLSRVRPKFSPDSRISSRKYSRASNASDGRGLQPSDSPEREPVFIAKTRSSSQKKPRVFVPSRSLIPPHIIQVKTAIVASAEALASELPNLAEHDEHPRLYDIQTIEAHITDQTLWEEGTRAYGVTTDDVLRWRNALASTTITDGIPHLIPSLHADRSFRYMDISVALPPPWLIHQLLLHRIRTPRDIGLSLRLLVTASSVLSAEDKWKLGLILLRQICTRDLTPMLRDCMTYILQAYDDRRLGRVDPTTKSKRRIANVIEAIHELRPSSVASRELLRALEAHKAAGFKISPASLSKLAAKFNFVTPAIASHIASYMEENGMYQNTLILRTQLEVAKRRGDSDTARQYLARLYERVSPAQLPGRMRLVRQLATNVSRYLSSHKDREDDSILEFIDQLKRTMPEWFHQPPVSHAVIDVLSQHAHISPERLFAYEEFPKHELSEAMLNIVRSNPKGATSAMARLLDRGRPEMALWLWHHSREAGATLDNPRLSIILGALGQLGRLPDAFAILCRVGGISLPAEDTKFVDSILPLTNESPDFHPDHISFNAFLSVLNHKGRFDMVWQLWNLMQSHFRVKPQVDSLNILIAAANYSKVLPTFSSGLQVFRNSFALGSERDDRMSPPEILDALKSPRRASDFWESLPPFQVARDIFIEMLGQNFPILYHVKPPVSGGRHEWKLFPALRSQPSPAAAVRDKEVNDPFFHLTLDGNLPPEPRWPHIHPDVKTFGSYVSMLGKTGHPEDIPLVLAWMRALHLTPKLRLLAVALMHYEDVGRPPAMIDGFIDQHGGNYGKLREWIAEWLGQEMLPEQEYIEYIRKIKLSRPN